MDRRTLGTFVASSALAMSLARRVAQADSGGGDVAQGLRRYAALPGTQSYLVHIGEGGCAGRISKQPGLQMFIASGYKTFVLGEYLRAVETGALSEDEELAIDDRVRDVGSRVFAELAGTTPARSVLEAMIAHSDNTATNAATLRVGASHVRALIARAGLTTVRIPDSTRIFESYVLGARPGVDFGWPGILDALRNPPGPLRPLLNDRITLAGSAGDLVSWYEQALQGSLFAKPETRAEFRRIQAMSIQLPRVVPELTVAYGKGGEVGDFYGANAKSFAGQMVVGRTPVTFAFILNWRTQQDRDFKEVETEFFAAIQQILTGIKEKLA